MKEMPPKYFVSLLALILLLVSETRAFSYRPIELDPNYSHDKWVTKPRDIVRQFRAFTVSFDSKDNDIALGIPEWVAYEIKPHPEPLGAGPDRPSTWMTDSEEGLAPTDDSYKHSKYDRGHMCPKYTAFRLGEDADWNTHTTLNACPQSPAFNQGIWKDLEDRITDWPDTGQTSVWTICGPVILNKMAIHWIGDSGEIRVAVPHGFYKIVVRQSEESDTPEVLAFLYPHHHLYKQKSPHNHLPYLVSVDYIEELTELDFLTILPDSVENAVEEAVAASLWE